jgi:hypothetical protein
MLGGVVPACESVVAVRMIIVLKYAILAVLIFEEKQGMGFVFLALWGAALFYLSLSL